MVEDSYEVTSGSLCWELGRALPFRDSTTGEVWLSESPDYSRRDAELAAVADIYLPARSGLKELMDEIVAKAWSVDSRCKIYFTVFYLTKAPYTFHSYSSEDLEKGSRDE